MQAATSTGEEEAGATHGAPAINFISQYIKALSIEVPQAPEVFSAVRQTPPDVRISIDTDFNPRNENVYEVIVTLEVSAAVADQPVFTVNLKYGCVVELNRRLVPEAHTHPVLFVEVPRQQFPFMRRLVADLTVRAGFQPVVMQPMDFGDVYKRKFGRMMRRADGPSAQPTG